MVQQVMACRREFLTYLEEERKRSLQVDRLRDLE